MQIQTKTLLVGAAAALVVFYVLKRRAQTGAVGWWQSLPGMSPGTQQAAMLSNQDREFY